MKRVIALLVMTVITILPFLLGYGNDLQSESTAQNKETSVEKTFTAPDEYAGTVTISINPEVCLYYDLSGLVLDVDYLNDDAKEAYSKLDLVGMKIEEAVELVVLTANEQGYIKNNNEISIVFGQESIPDEDLADMELRIQEMLEAAIEEYNISGVLILPNGYYRSMRTDIRLSGDENLIGRNIKDVPYYDKNGLPILAEPVFVKNYYDDYSHAGIILTQSKVGNQIKVTYDRGDVVFPAEKLDLYKKMGFTYFAASYGSTDYWYERIQISTPYLDYPIPNGYKVDTPAFDSGGIDSVTLPAGSPPPSNITVVGSSEFGDQVVYDAVRYYIYATKETPASEEERKGSEYITYDGISYIVWNDFVVENVPGDKIVEYSAQFVY